MDGNLKPVRTDSLAYAGGAMPPERTMEMPTQDVRRVQEHIARTPQSAWVTWPARAIANLGALGITGYGIYEMIGIAGFSNMTVLQAVMIFFFAITLGWIAFAATSAIAGFILPAPKSPEAPLGDSRTALLMPVYNEDPINTTAALQTMAEAIATADAARNFEIVIVSDSTNVDAWIAETLAVDRLRRALNGLMPVRYRRRWHNTGRKVGNVEDFVKRWGAHYEYMIVLDADSLMSADTLITLVKRIQADPELGLLQTVPALIGQQSLFARLQQFASRVFGNVIARGVAAWSGDDGNFWGHNAVIRISAFAQSCGLPQLPGRKPFGGHVLSHDFIEAAFLRRAGWKVRMAPDLEGSWEEGPPSLVDVAIRDRRWAQGNLQHLKLIRARGLSWTSRKHLGIGIMGYLSSPLWLMLILVGFALTLQATLIRPEYFSRTFQLFPNWPVFDAERMVSLFIFSMAVLLTPKALGLVRSILKSNTRRGCGGIIGLCMSTVVELILTALYAPIMMLIQTQHVFDILTGSDSDWVTQRRQAAVLSWRDAWHFHWKHTFVGIVIAVVAYLLSPTLLAWLSPAVAGLMLAIPLSKISGSVTLGQTLRRLAIFRIPEESAPHPMILRRNELVAAAFETPSDGLRHLARDATARVAHLAGNLPRPTDTRGHPHPQRLTAESKVTQAEKLQEALDWLSGPERMEVAADARLLERLAQLPD
jgi:membrane glycosyltransferase